MKNAGLRVVIEASSSVQVGDSRIELSAIKEYGIHDMSYGYLSRIFGNGFSSVSNASKISNNIGNQSFLFDEARKKAMDGNLQYISIDTRSGEHFIFFNVGKLSDWEKLNDDLDDWFHTEHRTPHTNSNTKTRHLTSRK